MGQEEMRKAAKIAGCVTSNAADLVEKLCEDEDAELRRIVWKMVAQQMAANRTCFTLPPMTDL